jgi:hypothetical protein
MDLFISAAVLAVLLLILSLRVPVSLSSPVYFLIGAYLVVLVAGTFIYDPNYEGAGVTLFLSEDESREMVVQVIWLLCAFALGACLFEPGSRAHRTNEGTRSRISFLKERASKFHSGTAVFIGFFAIALSVAGNGSANIYSRSEYLLEANHIVKIIGTAFLPLGAIAFGAASTTKRGDMRSAAFVGVIALLTLTLALNTRLFSLVPTLFFVGALMVRRDQKHLRWLLLASICAAPFLVSLPLMGRNMRTQGIAAFPDLFHELSQADPDLSIHEILNNLFISAPITVASARAEVDDSFRYILVGVNPLPGFMTEWESSQRRINQSTPFNAVGDLLRGGLFAGLMYFAAVGLYFAHIDRKLRSSDAPAPLLAVLMALSYLYVVTTFQYPLRNSTRLVYYMAAAELAFFLANGLRIGRRRETANARRQELQADEYTEPGFPGGDLVAPGASRGY